MVSWGTRAGRGRTNGGGRAATVSGEPVLVGVGDGLGSVADAGLGEEMIDMALYCGLADHQPTGDLYVRQSLGISASTSASRWVSPAGSCGVAAVDGPVAMALTRCCWTAGSMAAWPLVTRSSASRISPALASLVRYPRAPARSASMTERSSV